MYTANSIPHEIANELVSSINQKQKNMKIGIIGSGLVGRTLGRGFLSEGHQVMLGTRDKAKAEVVQWAKENPAGKTGNFSETAGFGELLVLATQGAITANAIDLAGAAQFSGKTVIDTTNPIAAAPPTNGVLHYFTSLEKSLMEQIQELLPDAHLVKAFNSVGNAFMHRPNFPGGKPSMFICGNDENAKKTVTGLLQDFGWEVEDMGKVESARAIEPLCMLWCIPGMLNNHWSHAFKLLKA
jgi:8-hydroxy-5-deazaflavin:NADPH oxidoreductase